MEKLINSKIDYLSFSKELKEYLKLCFLYVYKNINIPSYIHISPNDYLNRCLDSLSTLNGIVFVSLSDLSLGIPDLDNFVEDICYVGKNGNLELINGKYVPVSNGSYVCKCRGFTYSKDKVIYLLDDGNINGIIKTLFHELSHIRDGEKYFNFSNKIALSNEFRLMCIEGRAVLNEEYINIGTYSDDFFELCDDKSSIKIKTNNYYPLYSVIYKLLQIIYSDEDLDFLGSNNLDNVDWFEYLNSKYDVDNYDVYFNIVNILSVYKYGVSYYKDTSLVESFLHIFDVARNRIYNKDMCIRDIKSQIKVINDLSNNVVLRQNNKVYKKNTVRVS